ncbi:hypothetical protein [Nocardioides sp.]|uniref:hypothetical protein n=1 Tax=Nocardioides sp. TaxID=35761 RepID=UPI00286B3B82|nr:hypothetical protein [Nocardioides sp.]
MTQKRILRANARKLALQRDRTTRDAFATYGVDPDDPAVQELIDQLVEDDPAETAAELFRIAAQLLHEVADATGCSPDQVLARISRT